VEVAVGPIAEGWRFAEQSVGHDVAASFEHGFSFCVGVYPYSGGKFMFTRNLRDSIEHNLCLLSGLWPES